MSKAVLTRGATGGLLGGIVMAMWAMIVLWLTGVGFWTPLNLIAHVIWRGAPLDATFSWGGLVLGLIIHMMMSVALGLVLAALLNASARTLRSPLVSAVIGMTYGIVVWLVAQYAIWPAVDEAAAEAFTPWVFAIGHLMFGVVAALVISIPAAQKATAQTVR